MAMEEDLSVFFDTDDFAVSATYNGTTAVEVIHDRAFLDQFGVSSANPVALAQAEDIPTDAHGKTLLVGGITYTIRDRQPQDDGATVLLQLERAS